MKKRITVAIIGCGNRGCVVYGHHMTESFPDKYQIVALCDIQARVVERQGEAFSIPAENRFTSEEAFFAEKRADLLVIATQDKDHVRMTVKGLELGYDILVEKPLTSSREECRQLLDAQKKYGGKVLVGHVLRYAPAFRKAEELLRSGVIGKLITIESLEQVWFGHYAHSFTRGNWRRSDETSPMIIAKCCHDFDLLQYYAGSKCESLSSVGDLTWFKAENAPEGATERCADCPHIETCPYSAKRIYLDRWKRRGGNYAFTSTAVFTRPITEEAIWEMLRTSPYGRCVYHCDNNVVDHQLTTMTFENGVKATLTMMAFTGSGGRIMRFHGSLGEIILDEEAEYVKLKRFSEDDQIWKFDELVTVNAEGHGGGDYALVSELYTTLTDESEARTSLEASVESHLMAIAAEESRLAGGERKLVH